MTDEQKPVVIVVRDPDASNDYRVFGGSVETVDVDLGYSDLSDPEELVEWGAGHYDTAVTLSERGFAENRPELRAAGEYLRALVGEVVDRCDGVDFDDVVYRWKREYHRADAGQLALDAPTLTEDFECSRCGSRISIDDQVLDRRRLLEVVPGTNGNGGVLRFDGWAEYGDSYSSTPTCPTCLATFTIPDGWEVDYV